MDRADVEQKISNMIERRLANDESTTIPALTEELVKALKLPRLAGEDQDDELRIALHEGYRQIIGGVVRKSESARSRRYDPQLVLEGFERLQRSYSIVRDGKDTIIPIEEMTQTEAYAKRAELIAMRNGLDTHIREWDRYIEARWPLPKTLGKPA